jgi:hypothetical protein
MALLDKVIKGGVDAIESIVKAFVVAVPLLPAESMASIFILAVVELITGREKEVDVDPTDKFVAPPKVTPSAAKYNFKKDILLVSMLVNVIV